MGIVILEIDRVLKSVVSKANDLLEMYGGTYPNEGLFNSIKRGAKPREDFVIINNEEFCVYSQHGSGFDIYGPGYEFGFDISYQPFLRRSVIIISPFNVHRITKKYTIRQCDEFMKALCESEKSSLTKLSWMNAHFYPDI